MAHATRGIAATFVASTLALAACGGNDNVRGGGPAENQGNLAEETNGPQNGVVDTPSRDPHETVMRNSPSSQEANPDRNKQ